MGLTAKATTQECTQIGENGLSEPFFGHLCTLLRHCVSTQRGKRRAIRRVLSVVEIEHEYFIVVLEENGDAYRFRTAFPSNKEYYDHRVRDQGVNSGIWGDKK